jgi:hypothetical protein
MSKHSLSSVDVHVDLAAVRHAGGLAAVLERVGFSIDLSMVS